MGQYLTRRANQRHCFIIAQSVRRPWARNGAPFGAILGEKSLPTIEVALAREVAMARRSSDRLRVAEPPRFLRACRRRRARHNQRRSPCRDPQVESCPNCRCHGDVPAGVSKQSNNSSNNSPNHTSNTPISASVTGTSSGQSSVTVHIVRSRLARRAGSLRSLCRFLMDERASCLAGFERRSDAGAAAVVLVVCGPGAEGDKQTTLGRPW